MPEIKRSANVQWKGDSRSGMGTVSTASGALKDVQYNWSMRFEGQPGTNPEEMLAAAEAACYSMALSSQLTKAGHAPESIQTRATCIMTQESGGWKITRMALETRVHAPGVDEATFQKLAEDAKNNCPVSTVLKPGLQSIELDAKLE